MMISTSLQDFPRCKNCFGFKRSVVFSEVEPRQLKSPGKDISRARIQAARLTAQSFAVLLTMILSATMALACGFHNYAPQPTMVDRLLASKHIVLARPAPDNRFRFEPFQTLAGNPAIAEIPHLVDTTTQRKLAADPGASVLFAYDDETGSWQRLAYVDTALASVVDQIVPHLDDWRFGGDEDRLLLFAGLLNHPDDRIHRLALREIDLATYASLAALNIKPDPDRLKANLYAPADWDLRYIRVLLLGFEDDPGLDDFFRKGIQSSLHMSDGILAAFATAYLEHSDLRAIEVLSKEYLSDPKLSPAQQESFIEALALHSESGAQEMKDRIRASLSKLVRTRPELAPVVARQFGIRFDWSMQTELADVLGRGMLSSMSDVAVVAYYVGLARESAAKP